MRINSILQITKTYHHNCFLMIYFSKRLKKIFLRQIDRQIDKTLFFVIYQITYLMTLRVPGPFITSSSSFRLKFQAFTYEGFILSKVPGNRLSGTAAYISKQTITSFQILLITNSFWTSGLYFLHLFLWFGSPYKLSSRRPIVDKQVPICFNGSV